MEWRFTLDTSGTPTVIDDPIGWDDAKVIIKRDKILRGVFISYITDLEFHGTGFTKIQAFLAANTKCDILDCLVEYKCSENEPFTTFFDGAIYLADIKTDDTTCIISAKVEDNNLSQLILNRRDVSVILDKGFTLNGEVLADIETSMDIHDLFDGAYTWTDIDAFKVKDVWQYLISYITDNDVTFESTFFETDVNTINQWRLTFDAAFTAGHTITLNYTNVYGEQVVVTQLFDTTSDNTLNELMIQLFHVSTGLHFSGRGYSLYLDEEWASADIDFPTRVINAFSFLPFTMDSCVVTGAGAVTCTILEVTPYADGGSDLMLTSAFRVWDSTSFNVGELVVTLGQWFGELSKNYNLGLSTSKDSGTLKVKVEKLEDILETTTLLTLNNVENVEHKFNSDFLASSINVGSSKHYNFDKINPYNDLATFQGTEPIEVPLYKQDTWTTTECNKNIVNARNNFIVDPFFAERTARQRHQMLNLKDDNPLMILEAEDADAGTILTKKYEQITTVSGSTETNQGMNASLRNVNKIFFWRTALTQGAITNKELEFLQPTPNAVNIDKEYTFDYPLTRDNINDIMASPNEKIAFNGANNLNKSGWIKQITYPVNGDPAELKLLTE